MGAPFVANDASQANADTLNELKTQMTTVTEKVDSIDTTCELTTPNNTKIDAIHTEIFEVDAFESAVEVLVTEEIEAEKRSLLRDIAEELPRLDRSDYKDIDKISIRDIDVNITDIDDKDAIVNVELRVYYDSNIKDNVRKTVNLVVTVEDNEIDDIEVVA